ncbi:LamG domain-containing protein [Rubellicoccus peritrichatus]|uniref:LamG domain-containing protein n=1 Tax=Rubellicoccus peritrichatus TaxID=3080537 RepID=A0AAQ3L690_9BACT|nr:LamG domain-containing protein [Puniceicoccus sp. CR14]WOO40055.1 LamG domain-containing protein [Puniceicoccus sp. CR14]
MMDHLYSIPTKTTLLAILLYAGTSQAGIVGYWQFSGEDKKEVSAVVSEVNESQFDSEITAGNNGPGTLPVYSTDTPGKYIVDGKRGPVINERNETSIKFSGKGSLGSFLQIFDGDNGTLELYGPITLEAFVKSNGNTFASIIMKEEFATTGSIGIATDYTPTRVRIHSARERSSVIDTNKPIGASIDNGDWHHIALVFDGDNETTLYYDYRPIGTIQGNPTDSWQPNGPLNIGGITGNKQSGNSLFAGLIDEVRLTNDQLEPDEFLIARDKH